VGRGYEGGKQKLYKLKDEMGNSTDFVGTVLDLGIKEEWEKGCWGKDRSCG